MSTFLDKEGLQLLVDDLKKRYILDGAILDASKPFLTQGGLSASYHNSPFIFIKNVRVVFDSLKNIVHVYKSPGTISVYPCNTVHNEITQYSYSTNIINIFGDKWDAAAVGEEYFTLECTTYDKSSYGKFIRKLTEFANDAAGSTPAYYQMFMSSRLYVGLKTSDSNFAAVADPTKYADEKSHVAAIVNYFNTIADTSQVIIEPGVTINDFEHDNFLFELYLSRSGATEITATDVTNKLNS